jgi:nicotinamidase/pyrazinamidase
MDREVIFLDIDTQYDFMSPQGKLYVSGAQELIPNLKLLFRIAERNNIAIISSLDTHKRDDPEFKHFPPHCIKGTRGHKKIKETIKKATAQTLVVKNTLDVFSNQKMKRILKPYNIAYVFGVALDYCVKAACLGLVNLGIKTYLVKDATSAVSAKGKQETLRLLKQRGVVLVTTEEVIKRLKRILR